MSKKAFRPGAAQTRAIQWVEQERLGARATKNYPKFNLLRPLQKTTRELAEILDAHKATSVELKPRLLFFVDTDAARLAQEGLNPETARRTLEEFRFASLPMSFHVGRVSVRSARQSYFVDLYPNSQTVELINGQRSELEAALGCNLPTQEQKGVGVFRTLSLGAAQSVADQARELALGCLDSDLSLKFGSLVLRQY